MAGLEGGGGQGERVVVEGYWAVDLHGFKGAANVWIGLLLPQSFLLPNGFQLLVLYGSPDDGVPLVCGTFRIESGANIANTARSVN